MPPYTLPEITPTVLAQWLRDKPRLILLDVREENEAAYAP